LQSEKPAAHEKPVAEKKPAMTTSQQNAVESAKKYLDIQSFSKSGLIEQLSSSAGEGFTRGQAEYAVNKVY
jgi:hypothetical protein